MSGRVDKSRQLVTCVTNIYQTIVAYKKTYPKLPEVNIQSVPKGADTFQSFIIKNWITYEKKCHIIKLSI